MFETYLKELRKYDFDIVYDNVYSKLEVLDENNFYRGIEVILPQYYIRIDILNEYIPGDSEIYYLANNFNFNIVRNFFNDKKLT